MMKHGKRSERRRRRSPFGYVITAAALTGAVAGGYLLSTNLPASEPDPGTGVGLSMIPPPPTDGHTARAGNARPNASELTDRCVDELTAGQNLLTTAQDGVDHWTAHVQARTDGLSGKITNEEMRAIWKETRLAGPDDIAAFDEVADRYEAAAGSCEAAAGVDDSAIRSECLAMATLLAASAETARQLIGAWDGHLANMRKFADGGMTAEQAQDEWEQAWAQAPADIDAHAASVQAVADAPDCDAQT